MFTFEAFFDHLGNLDWVGVLLATLAIMLAGPLWYGPIFGKPWSAAAGASDSTNPSPGKILATAVYSFGLGVGMSFFAAPGVQHAAVGGCSSGSW